MLALLASGQLTAADRLILTAVEQYNKRKNSRGSFWEPGMSEHFWIEPVH